MSHSRSGAFDVAIVGGGPGGATCAAFAARSGLKTVLLERSRFPRDKVCGDCLNPAAWPILDRMGVSEEVRGLAHARLEAVDYVGCDDQVLTYSLSGSAVPEIAVRRRDLDSVLLQKASECGAEVREEVQVTAVRSRQQGADAGWQIETAGGNVHAQYLVAADGRNSTVLRSLGLYPATRRDRAGVQTHFPLPGGMKGRVRMRFRPEGYCGLADIGGGEANLCLVARPDRLEALKTWAHREFQLAGEQTWRAITPLSRAPIRARHCNLLLVGDTARVVEPFTGEGIYYAMATGELAASALVSGTLSCYREDHAALYRGRLWINRLAKAACLYPRMATHVLRLCRARPAVLGAITRKIVKA